MKPKSRMKGKRKLGFNPDDDEELICRRLILNTLVKVVHARLNC